MLNRLRKNPHVWLHRLAIGGMLLGMAPTTCDTTASEIGAGLFAGITSSIINQFVADTIAGFFNSSSGSFF